ncbi:MAG: UbiA family prenyltransferase [Pseudomonadota bacterium]|jgi:4-hydroxybenzoate polyprenyltransferase
MLRDLWRYIRERFALPASLPLSAILWLAAPWHRAGAFSHIMAGCVGVFFALLALRIADDINSLEQDRLRKPERGLCSGAISAAHLRTWVVCLLPCALVLQAFALWPDNAAPASGLLQHSAPNALLITGTVLAYCAYFHYKKRLPLLLRPCCSNLLFLTLPLLGLSATSDATHWPDALWLGLFCWCSAIGHEFAHNVRAANESEAPDGQPLAPDYVDLLGSRGVFWLALGLYLLASIAALALVSRHSLHPVFGWSVALAVIGLAFLFARLWQQPGLARARALYVPGFLFFLLPLLLDLLAAYLTPYLLRYLPL